MIMEVNDIKEIIRAVKEYDIDCLSIRIDGFNMSVNPDCSLSVTFLI